MEELYSDNNERSSRYIRANIDRENLMIELQDIGPLVEEFWGDSDYESGFTVKKADIKSVLKIKSDEELFRELKNMYNDSQAFDNLLNFCVANNIKSY